MRRQSSSPNQSGEDVSDECELREVDKKDLEASEEVLLKYRPTKIRLLSSMLEATQASSSSSSDSSCVTPLSSPCTSPRKGGDDNSSGTRLGFKDEEAMCLKLSGSEYVPELKCTLYTLDVGLLSQGQSWSVQRRYSDFLQFHKQSMPLLKKNGVSNVRFPSRWTPLKNSKGVVKKRLVSLGKYMEIVLSCDEVMGSSHTFEFLRLDNVYSLSFVKLEKELERQSKDIQRMVNRRLKQKGGPSRNEHVQQVQGELFGARMEVNRLKEALRVLGVSEEMVAATMGNGQSRDKRHSLNIDRVPTRKLVQSMSSAQPRKVDIMRTSPEHPEEQTEDVLRLAQYPPKDISQASREALSSEDSELTSEITLEERVKRLESLLSETQRKYIKAKKTIREINGSNISSLSNLRKTPGVADKPLGQTGGLIPDLVNTGPLKMVPLSFARSSENGIDDALLGLREPVRRSGERSMSIQ